MTWLRIALFLSLFLSSISQACTAPTTAELNSFFGGQSRWTKVLTDDNRRRDNRLSVNISINFSNLNNSVLSFNGSALGRLSRVCRRSSNSLTLVTNRGNFVLKKNGGVISTSIPIIGKVLFRPAKGVRADIVPDNTEGDVDYAEEISEQETITTT
ncbi:MAG: hypothetical protein HRT44_02610 [Bdellovibrionales bacterium]|nr:hypothetical protein [Bdellovibrionales bacterium]NQZ18139.1 hypothetical protein [Bdellovibrionales bacterium]